MNLQKPLLVFDGDCGFCKSWIERWKVSVAGRVDFDSYQFAGANFPEIKTEEFEQAVHLIEPGGEVSRGAKAVFKALSYSASPMRFIYKLYEKSRLFARLTEKAYAVVAARRRLFSKVTYAFWGDNLLPPTYNVASDLFVKILSLILLSAFFSAYLQMNLLMGPDGLAPVSEFLADVQRGEGGLGYYLYPTLAWLNSSAFFMKALCLTGAAASIACLFRVMPWLMLLICWILYLSVSVAGGVFYAYQWDTLLLESTFFAIFLTRSNYHPRFVFLMRLVLFKVVFLSGIAKLKSGDPTWRDLTAISFHLESQPLPTWIAWYAHQLSQSILKAATAVALFIEIVVPFFFFLPRRLQLGAFVLHTALQIGILLTGNYCFFNFLALALGLFLLDDSFFKIRRSSAPRFREYAIVRYGALPLLVIQLLCIFSFKPISYPVFSILSPLRTFNRYALFSVMATSRYEVTIEGSRNGVDWKEYGFRHKPGDLSRAPGFAIPYQPRLDWQMWFAAFSDLRMNPWLQALMMKVLSNDEEALGAFAVNPFSDKPPNHVRARFWSYRFTTLAEKRETGNWWVRAGEGEFSPVFSITHVE